MMGATAAPQHDHARDRSRPIRPIGSGGLDALCIVTAAMFLTPTAERALLRAGERDKLLFHRVKRRALWSAMRGWSRDAGVEVYCVVNGGGERDLERLRALGVHVDDRRADLAGHPAQQRREAFALAWRAFRPAGVQPASRLFLWSEPDKHHLDMGRLVGIARAAQDYDLTIVNRSARLLASYDRGQAELERGSNRVLSEQLAAVARRARVAAVRQQLDALHGPRVFRGDAVGLAAEQDLAPDDPMEMYGMLNKPLFRALMAGLRVGAVELDGCYPVALRRIDERIDRAYRRDQNRGIVANLTRWLAATSG